MRRYPLFIFTALYPAIMMISCSRDSSFDTALYTVEIIDEIRYIHNFGPQKGESSPVSLELIGKIGELESEEEEDILYDPADAARLANGDILILENQGNTVKRYDKNYQLLNSFGQKGQGPGDIMYPYCLRLNNNRNKIIIEDVKISFFSLEGKFESSFKPKTNGSSSITRQYERAGMAVLSGSHVVLPSPHSIWSESGDNKLLSIYDQTGSIIRSFGEVKSYQDPSLTLNANIAYFTSDSEDNIYVAYGYQNKIGKYTREGKALFFTDRPLPYEIKNELQAIVMKSGGAEKVFHWPSVTSVARSIGLDSHNRIWVLTYLKHPNKSLTFDVGENLTDCYEFQVFDDEGIFLFKVPFPNVRFDNLSIYDDRLYLIDARSESCVYEFRIKESK